jgi:hypothetical protein
MDNTHTTSVGGNGAIFILFFGQMFDLKSIELLVKTKSRVLF